MVNSNSSLVKDYIANESQLEKILISCIKESKQLKSLLKELEGLKEKYDKVKEQADKKNKTGYSEKEDTKRAAYITKGRAIIDGKIKILAGKQCNNFDSVKNLISKLEGIKDLNVKKAFGIEIK